MQHSEPILLAKNITRWFGEAQAKTIAVNHANFQVNYGEMRYIVGPSGSGKTTLLSIISGILRPQQGSVTIKGKEIWQLEDDDLTDFRLHSIGFVFQDFHLFPRLTSQENVAIPLILQHHHWDDAMAKAAQALAIVGLEARKELAPYKLSIGEQQRVAIARAIITEPDILFLDEPTASLDGDTGKKIIAFIKENILNERRAIIVVTHDNRIYDYASRISYMEDGCLRDAKDKDEHE